MGHAHALWPPSFVVVFCVWLFGIVVFFFVILKNIYFPMERFPWPGRIGIGRSFTVEKTEVKTCTDRARGGCLRYWVLLPPGSHLTVAQDGVLRGYLFQRFQMRKQNSKVEEWCFKVTKNVETEIWFHPLGSKAHDVRVLHCSTLGDSIHICVDCRFGLSR